MGFEPRMTDSRSSKVKGHGAKLKPRYGFLYKANSNYMPKHHRF